MIRQIPPWIMRGSIILAFCAGMVNCVALLGFANNAVSHVTGTVTLAAHALATSNVLVLKETGLIVAAFFVGAVISGCIVKNESLALGRRYGFAMFLEAGLLLVATLLFRRHNFGGELFASMACGLQNAMVATYSGSVIRTTHLTGILSDIGAAIGNFLGGRPLNRLQVKLQTAIFSSFAAGAAAGSWFFNRLHYQTLIIPAVALIVTAGLYQAWFARQERHKC